ncbi:MAG TPA: HAD-IC family P-type ATPase, partial [Actinomycetes bacterium]
MQGARAEDAIDRADVIAEPDEPLLQVHHIWATATVTQGRTAAPLDTTMACPVPATPAAAGTGTSTNVALRHTSRMRERNGLPHRGASSSPVTSCGTRPRRRDRAAGPAGSLVLEPGGPAAGAGPQPVSDARHGDNCRPDGAFLNREHQGTPRTAAPEFRVGLADGGLSDAEAARRLAADGPNELPAPRRERLLSRLLRQFAEPMSLLLLAAAAVSGLVLGERLDAVAITVIVALNAAVGLVQEGRAAHALEALRRLETPLARVERAGLVRTVPARELVVGDLVHLAAGDRVPADLGLGAASALEVDESLLTGESLPVAKTAGDPGPDGQLWSGTLVTRGAGQGVVTATGTATKLGTVAAGLEGGQDPTPLQRELAALSARLGLVAVGVAAGVFALILVRTGLSAAGLGRAFLAAVALAVAAVPEGLPTVVTVALALGVRRMAGHGALVRRLPAVETLGAATVLATDKTGTLTENRLRLATVDLAGAGAAARADGLTGKDARPLATVAVCCNDAQLDPPAGDPVDLALLEAVGPHQVARLRAAWTRLAGLPFDAERRRMTVLVAGGAQRLLLVKGAPETVLARCTRRRSGPAVVPLSAPDRAGLLERTAVLARRGERVLALAWQPFAPQLPAGADLEELDGDLELVGLVGLADPLRPTAPGAVAEAQAAGIRLLMVTGDHP